MQIFDSYIIHDTQYYETDQMGVIHHANYLKWIECSRNNFFKSFGINIPLLEKKNLLIPVLSESIKYVKYLKFGDRVKVTCKCKKFDGIKISFEYIIYNEDSNEICAYGETKHGFVDKKFNPVFLKEKFLKIYDILDGLVNGKNQEKS